MTQTENITHASINGKLLVNTIRYISISLFSLTNTKHKKMKKKKKLVSKTRERS